MKRWNGFRRSAGFTLAETLITTLILLMVTAVVAAGIPVAVNAYDYVVDQANAQVLLSTTVARLREELSTAVAVELTSGTIKGEDGTDKSVDNIVDCYNNGDMGINARLINSDSYGVETADLPEGETPPASGAPVQGIWIEYTTSMEGKNIVTEPLVQELKLTNRKGGQLYAEYCDSITYENGIFTVNRLEIKRIDRDTPLLTLPSLKIRAIIAPTASPASP